MTGRQSICMLDWISSASLQPFQLECGNSGSWALITHPAAWSVSPGVRSGWSWARGEESSISTPAVEETVVLCLLRLSVSKPVWLVERPWWPKSMIKLYGKPHLVWQYSWLRLTGLNRVLPPNGYSFVCPGNRSQEHMKADRNKRQLTTDVSHGCRPRI